MTAKSSIVVFLLLFVMLGCKARRDEGAAYQSPFEIKGEKVLIEGERKVLAVLVDEDCLRRAHSRNVLTKSIALPERQGTKRSVEQTYRVELAAPLTRDQLRVIARRDACIKGVAADRIASVDSTPDDPMLAKQSHLGLIEALEAFQLVFDDSSAMTIKEDVTIAVIDTGIDVTHPDLKGHLWINEAEKNGLPLKDDDGNGFIDDIYGYNFPSNLGDPRHETINDHGSHVAGLAAAVSGNSEGGIGAMSRKVKLMALNAFGKSWGADVVDIDRAIRYAADQGANVINISTGGPGESPTTAAAVAYALNKGVVVVVSAGNERKDISNEFYFLATYAPGYAGMISVSAIDAANESICEFANFSSRDIEILAPGCDSRIPGSGLLSTRAGGSYGLRRGTSQAAPLVSAAAAMAYGLVRARLGSKPSPREIEELLTESCEKKPALKKFGVAGCELRLARLVRAIEKKFSKP